MLSKTEQNLAGNVHPSKNYEYKILHSIRRKLKTFSQIELPLIESKPEVIGEKVSYLGKLTSYQAVLNPLKINWSLALYSLKI